MQASSSPEMSLSEPEQREIAASALRKAQASQSDTKPSTSQRKGHKTREYKTYNYDYLPKRRGAIRLLNLFSSENADAGVLCELITPKENQKGDFRYEALSWCWGTGGKSEYIRIQKRGKTYAKYVSPNLVAALKALRHPTKSRYLWVDMVCIDQDNLNEKNHQVEMMHDIYGNAERVLIWLGEANDSSRMALRFIKDEVAHLQSFDTLCDSKDASKKWVSLLELMQRPWFSRRWVVQEIALARKAVIYCGDDRISWKRFAIAVELFVEVETATHRLSEVMKRDRQYRYVPGWFEYVSALGASLLVDATERLFRDYKEEHIYEPDMISESEYDSDSESSIDGSSSDAEGSAYTTSSRGRKDVSNTKTQIQPLLSLEYLVSSLTIFDTTVPHDTIYALLAIAKDTTPRAVRTEAMQSREQAHYGLDVFTQRKRYKVDYKLAYVDVCKEFIQFCIHRSLHVDRSRSLDVICRPWATDERILASIRAEKKRAKQRKEKEEKRRRERENRRAPKHAQRASIDSGKMSSHAHSEKPEATSPGMQLPNGTGPSRGPSQKTTFEEEDMPLPSWVPQLSSAPYAMARRPGLTGPKMSRINADPLVGLPGLTHRNYSAAESKGVDMKALKFRKRTDMGHFSMYVRGFLLDTIQDVEQVARNGQIPREWADLGGWPTAKGHPPDAFWRTLVADRGKDGKNPPVYYSRACEESFKKGGLESGAIDTTALINYERNSVVAQFCRRVQAVTWNRALVKTEGGRLGLVGKEVEKGDQVCILYGCSVPVILRESPRKTPEVFNKEIDWELKYVTDKIADCYKRYASRKRRHELRKDVGMIPLCKKWSKATNWLHKKGLTKDDIFQAIADIPSDKTRVDRAELIRKRIRARMIELLKHALRDFSDWRAKQRMISWPGGKAKNAKGKEGKEKMDEVLRKRKARQLETQRKRRKSLTSEQDAPPAILNGTTNGTKSEPIQNSQKKDNPFDWWAFEYELIVWRRWRQIFLAEKKAAIQSALKETKELRKNSKRVDFEKFKTERKDQGKWVEPKHPKKEPSPQPGPNAHPSTISSPEASTVNISRSETLISEWTTSSMGEGIMQSAHIVRTTELPQPRKVRPSWVRAPLEPRSRQQKKKKKGKSDEHKIRDYLTERAGEEGWFSYKLLGECYIHGMMDGGAMLYQNEGEDDVIPSMVFEIR